MIVSYPAHKEHASLLKALREDTNPNTLGKYLIFSDNQQTLIRIGEQICKRFSLSEFQVSMKNNNNGMFSYVLKISDIDQFNAINIKIFLKQNNFWRHVEYRYWKVESDSKKGKYSSQYLDSLDV